MRSSVFMCYPDCSISPIALSNYILMADFAMCTNHECPNTTSTFAIPVLAGIACLLSLPPIFIHVKAGNFAATVLVASTAVANLFNFINAIIWPTDNPHPRYYGQGLCDVETKIYVGLTALPVAAVACIFRQLAIILDTERATPRPSRGQIRRRRIIEGTLCILVPTYLMAIHYVVQSERYYIYGVAGCSASFHRSWPSYVLVLIWPVILCIVGSTYALVAAYRLVRYRRQFSRVISSSSTTSRSNFVRLFALSGLLIAVYLPLTVFTFQQNLDRPLLRYSWAAVHGSDWSSLILFVQQHGQVRFDRVVQIGTGYLVFCFFGFGRDAMALYKEWVTKAGIYQVLQAFGGRNVERARAGSASTPVLTGNNAKASPDKRRLSDMQFSIDAR